MSIGSFRLSRRGEVFNEGDGAGRGDGDRAITLAIITPAPKGQLLSYQVVHNLISAWLGGAAETTRPLTQYLDCVNFDNRHPTTRPTHITSLVFRPEALRLYTE